MANLIDLTHSLTNGMPVWPGHPVFEQRAVASFAAGDIACNHSLHLSEHCGTHFDAPLHFVPGGQAIDAVPLERFFCRLAVVAATDTPPGSELGPDRLLAWEVRNGAFRPGDAVMFHFGWDRFWGDPERGERFLADWPGLSGAAAELLVERGVLVAGSDCMSIDRYACTDFPAHRVLLGAGVLIGENFANLGCLPPICELTALPLRIANGSGAPLRAVARISGMDQQP